MTIMLLNILKGLGTFIPGLYNTFSRKKPGGAESARYCYSVWLRHLVMLNKNGLSINPMMIAELGPGESIGIGLAALISGADKYYAFDIVKYANVINNIKIFDELVSLFKKRENIPGEKEFPEMFPLLNFYAFPKDILTNSRLNVSLGDRRLNHIRESVENMNMSGSVIQYKAPWYNFGNLEKESIDMVFSQAVLEHVDELSLSYSAMYSWLKPGGCMSHTIDFRSHGTANEWNGHLVYSDFIWKLIKGKRPYLINRVPHFHHIKIIKDIGFTVVCDLIKKSSTRIGIGNLSSKFQDMLEEDLTTSAAFIQAVK